jgi:class 3 adenylate cyclase/tetratricopeptide (TPR) repeat protein
MFTDMVGFSAVTQHDEPLALKLVDEQRSLVRPVFGQFGGREVKTMGDGSLVVFDSALDATECAVEIQRQLFERNRDMAGERIELRVGIHVGDVVHSENDVYGDAVNIASRVEPLAEAGGVCVTGPVYEQVQNKIAHPFKPVERPFLKNIETPVSVYRIELPWTPPSLSEATPFTDRKEELDRLKRAWAGLVAGEGIAIAITGEAGVGKTRLAKEFVSRAARDGARILYGRADPGGISAPFASWSEAVRDFAREAPNPLLYTACADCAAEVAELVPELRSRLGRGAEPLRGDEPSETRFFEGILRFLENLSREAPVIVLLDDLQWSDSASLHLLEFVARRVSGRRVLLVLAFRDEQPSELGGLEALVEGLGREHRLELIRLKRFDSSTSVQMLRQMLRGRVPVSGGDLAAPVFEKSGGNPMILEAIVRSLVGEGSLVWTGEGWAPKAGVEIRLPPGIESAVRRRLAQLAPPTVDVLRQASVLGSQFSFVTLQRVTGSPSEQLLTRLEEAIRARILEERSAGSGRSTYAFTDRPVLETLYDEISLVRRARYHSNAARVLESLVAEGVGVPAAELAHHFLRANEYDKALEYTLLAAEEAARLFARDEALRQYATAKELLESLPNEKRRAEVLFNVGEQLDLLGRHSEAYRSMRESAEVYERIGLTTEAGGVHTSIARRISAHNEPVRAMEHLEKARRLLETGPPSFELARLYDTIGLVMYQEVRLREAAENWLRAIDVAGKVGAFRVEATARRMLASIVPPGENAKVWEYLDTALVLATKAEARPVVSDVMVVKSIALLSIRGDGRGALRTAEDAIEYARRGHDVLDEMFTKGNLVTYIEWRLGDLPRAEQVALEHRAFVAGDPHRDRPTAIAVLADVALARGEIDRAEKLLWEGERLLAEGGDWSENSHMQIVLARCALARRKPLSAIEHLRVSYALCRKAGPPAIDALLLLETLALLVRAHLDAGEAEEAEPWLRELSELARTFGENLGQAFLHRAEGWMQAHRGETPAAIASLQESTSLWKRLGWQYEWAQTLLSLAAVYRTSGDAKRAAALTDQAAEFFSMVGARPEFDGSGRGQNLALP